MTFPSDWLFFSFFFSFSFFFFTTDELSPLPDFFFLTAAVHMCFNNHILGRSVLLFKMFESLPNALLIKWFFFFVVNAACSSDAHAELKDARPNWLSTFYLWGIDVFYVEVKMKLTCA